MQIFRCMCGWKLAPQTRHLLDPREVLVLEAQHVVELRGADANLSAGLCQCQERLWCWPAPVAASRADKPHRRLGGLEANALVVIPVQAAPTLHHAPPAVVPAEAEHCIGVVFHRSVLAADSADLLHARHRKAVRQHTSQLLQLLRRHAEWVLPNQRVSALVIEQRHPDW